MNVARSICWLAALMTLGGLAASAADSSKAGQEILDAVKSHYVDPAAWSDGQLNDAILAGLSQKLGPGIEVVVPSDAPAVQRAPFYSEVLEEQFLYARLRSFSDPAALASLGSRLSGESASKKRPVAVVLDLRDFEDHKSFDKVPAVASLFLPADQKLFSMINKTGKKEEYKSLTGEPSLLPLAVLVNRGTEGSPEVLAWCIREQRRGIVVGVPTAGKPVAYTEVSLPDGRLVRVASKKALKADGSPLFPNPIKPDITVTLSPEEEAALTPAIEAGAMADLVKEHHSYSRQNEAALVRGENPEIDAYREEMESKKKSPGEEQKKTTIPRDEALLAALDIFRAITALEIKPVYRPVQVENRSAQATPNDPSPSATQTEAPDTHHR